MFYKVVCCVLHSSGISGQSVGSTDHLVGRSVCPSPGSSTMCSPHANLSITLKHVVRGTVAALC